MIYQKGYQETGEIESAVTCKVKGIIKTDFSDEELINVQDSWKYLYNRIWDVTDFVVPPVENNAFFVMTNVVITPNQTRGECPEVGIWNCTYDSDCPKDGINNLGNIYFFIMAYIICGNDAD